MACCLETLRRGSEDRTGQSSMPMSPEARLLATYDSQLWRTRVRSVNVAQGGIVFPRVITVIARKGASVSHDRWRVNRADPGPRTRCTTAYLLRAYLQVPEEQAGATLAPCPHSCSPPPTVSHLLLSPFRPARAGASRAESACPPKTASAREPARQTKRAASKCREGLPRRA